MDLDDIVKVADRDAPLHQVAEVGEEGRCARNPGGGPDEPAGLGVDPDLGKSRPASRDVPERARARRGGGREGDSAVVGPGRGDGVVVAEAHRLRDARIVHDGAAAEDVLGGDHALPAGRGREVGRADDVACCVDTLNARAHMLVHDDRAVRPLAEPLQRLRMRDEPGGEENGIGLDLFAAGEQDRADTGAALDAQNSGLFADADPGEVAHRGGAHLRIEVAEQPVPGDDLDF